MTQFINKILLFCNIIRKDIINLIKKAIYKMENTMQNQRKVQQQSKSQKEKKRDQQQDKSTTIKFENLQEYIINSGKRYENEEFKQNIQENMMFGQDDQNHLQEETLKYLMYAKIQEDRQKKKDCNKKYVIEQKVILSKKIGKKLEANQEVKKQQKQQITEKQRFFEKRKEQFQKNESLLSKLEDSFQNNKSNFNTLWENSENNLKAQVDMISENILKPIQVNLSQKEISITLCNQNQLIIGRSGTGKTTTAVVKLTSMQMGYDKAQQSNKNSQKSEELRICFTTISNFLTLDVENFFLRIMNKSKLISFSKPNTLSQIKKWPHFTNLKELILQIDGNLAVPFIQRDDIGKIIQAQNMEINLENRLIVKLKDEIDNNLYSEIGVRQFVDEFWQSNKKSFDQGKVDPYVAFSQINSYITGNQASHQNEDNMISEEKYLNLVGKSKTDLEQEQKMIIYQICKEYQQWKYSKKYFDFNDVINYIIKNIIGGNYDSVNGYFHYLFVDEVQDLNCASLYLLCLLTEQNVYLGGDTAQTISQENCFKFADLKAIFSENNKDDHYQANQVLTSELNETQLIQNFRSHGQIIELNNAIVELLRIFFPTSLDILNPEISFNKGPKPILLNKREHLYNFLSQDSDINENVDYFGRLQVYIVKNQEEKASLKQLLQKEGKKGQIFTVLESKGLEFQDVIAYKLLSSSFYFCKCWNVLNLLKISEEEIPIEDFKLKYHCQMQEEFEGSTFSRTKGSNFVKMKIISKQENTEAQIKKKYAQDFSKLINELKNIYVTFSRARSRIFIYEENIFVGKQIKNPIIKFLEDLSVIKVEELNEQLIEKIMKDHLDYIKKHEPIKNNKQQFISMAEMLIERKQFLDAAYYYDTVGDELNKRICIGKNKIFEVQKKIEDKKDQFEKEKKLMLQGQADIKNSVFYQSIKNDLLEAIENLKGLQEFELKAQVYFKLGMYNEALQNYKEFKILLLESSNQNQDHSKIKEVDDNIKHIYFLKADLLEAYINNQNALEQNYKELENFLEKDGIQDTKVQLYLSFRLNDYEKLFNNLIKFKENNLIEKEDLIHILHYYYPKILDIKLLQIMQIDTDGKQKKDIYNSKTILGKVLIKLIQQLIIPFKEEFVRIAKSRQNMEFFQEQLKLFNQLSQTEQLINLDKDKFYINGENLMLFYIMLIQFDCLEQQKKFNDILQQQELSHQIFVDQILQNKDQQKIIQNKFDEMKQLTWLLSGKQKEISISYQYYYAYLGLYDELKNRNLVTCSSNFHQYQNFTFQLIQLRRQDQYKKFNNLYDQIFYVQSEISKGQLFKKKNKQHTINMTNYKNVNRVLQNPELNKILKNIFKDIFDLIKKKNIISNNPIEKFIKCQDLFLSFFFCLKKLKNSKMQLLENDFIIEFTNLIRFFFNFNYLLFESSLFGELNGIFQDAFCSCFGFISPYLPGQVISNEDFKHLWQLIGYNDYYLVNEDNPYLDESIVEKDRLISPIISPIFSKLKIIEKKTAVMLSKKYFGQYCTEFLKRYSDFLMKQTYEKYYQQLNPKNKIKYPFQILYLNDCLQQFIEKINQQISILEQNIPKKHAREHEIQSIKNLIDQIEKSNQINQNEQKLLNLKRLFNNKIESQYRDNQKNKMILKKIRLLEDSQIYQCKNNIIQQGLVINSFLYNKNFQVKRDEIQQYLLNEASNTLASILNKIEKQDNQNEIDQLFENLKKQIADQNQKYKEQFDKQFLIEKKENIKEKQDDKDIQSKNLENNFDDKEIKLQQQQSKEEGEYQGLNETQEEIQNESESILKSCDDILYAITILNMCNQRSVLRDLFKGYENNQLSQFTQMCLQFFQSRNVYDRINIGLLSNQLLLMFKQNINTLTQINIFKIGLAEVYLLLNITEIPGKINVSIPYGFENCFSYHSQTQEQFKNQQEKHDKNKNIIYIKVKTYSTDIDYKLLLKNNDQQPFENSEQYSQHSNQAYKEENQLKKQHSYFLFSQKFHKTFLYLAEQAANPQTKNDQNNKKPYDLIGFINSIRYSEIQFILIIFENYQSIQCELQIEILEKQEEVISSNLIDEENEIRSHIIRIRNDLNSSNNEDLTEQDYINIFYKQDFVIFISQELSLNKFSSSEKYIYIIQKLNNLMIKEQEFYRQMILAEEKIDKSQEFKNYVQKLSIDYINQMEKVYSNYLDYITEPFEKIEKERLDIHKFIQEQINSIY
ncbi:hypothetical protein TTHERM_00827200 (macronuclear) [Tetrahymena thermophila SB210]|uniref:UvrD-like helicase ATP-binding domain-containing protein n=1 Tax=Tetrahymena thermophila (strain SB210) TaxID=312017 RepID=Q22EE9_TETTS|nr:hypothetical protein TTHERM_00827200 [Tetrahymena thermophila SB210]EAR83703.3 hypothetical protein TTHERM_00827200 [Tetrahymena thermophila SB210]|eukprot:XP_001031366.3 hypothetical protein TTHERM_00827200 [Tetrahymena thermophila SB210]